MKYEFHVGDYVETIGGFVGRVYKVGDDGYIWVTNKGIAPCSFWSSYSYRMPEELKYFKRIGQYDFTKKDEGKIEPLCEEYTKSFPLCTTTTAENGLEWRNIDIGAVGEKINELVEAVNRLEEKVNEMSQS